MGYRRYRRRYYRRAPADDVFEGLILIIAWLIRNIFEMVVSTLAHVWRGIFKTHHPEPTENNFYVSVAKDNLLQKSSEEYTKFPPITPEHNSIYEKRYRLMNDSEASFHNVLQKAIPPSFHIFPKMRIADIIKTKDGKGYYRNRNMILPKHVDFVVCSPDFKPLVAIEIDGGSHNRADRMERDRQVDEIFKEAGVPLEHIRVGESFSERCEQLQNYFPKM